jgi:hypothetical protein
MLSADKGGVLHKPLYAITEVVLKNTQTMEMVPIKPTLEAIMTLPDVMSN